MKVFAILVLVALATISQSEAGISKKRWSWKERDAFFKNAINYFAEGCEYFGTVHVLLLYNYRFSLAESETCLDHDKTQTPTL